MRYRRHIRRLIALLALPALLAVLLTFPTGWGCRLAERIVRRLDLVQAVPGLTFNFQHLSPTRVEIGGVALGTEAGAPALERLTVRFTPRIRRHTIGEIEATPARLIVGSNRVTLAGMELLESAAPPAHEHHQRCTADRRGHRDTSAAGTGTRRSWLARGRRNAPYPECG